MKSTIFAFLLSLVCLTAFSQSAEESKVIQRVKDLNDAIFVRKDGNAIQGFLSDKLSYGHSDAKLEDKATMIHNAVTNKIAYQNVETLSLRVVSIENNTAVVRHIITGVQTDSTGKPGPLALEVMQVWEKEKKEWKLLARQSVKLPMKN